MTRSIIVYWMGAAGLAVFAWSACAQQHDSINRPTTRPAATAPASRPVATAEMVDLAPGPIVQFEETCARCHGPQGSFYGEEFGHLEPPELKAMVLQMMEGPAGLTPTPRQLAAMVAYHVALRAAAPFVLITNAEAFTTGRDRDLRGEVTPDAAVEIRKDGQVIRAVVEDMAWTVSGAPRPPFAVVARKEGKQAVVEFPTQQWSVPPSASKSR